MTYLNNYTQQFFEILEKVELMQNLNTPWPIQTAIVMWSLYSYLTSPPKVKVQKMNG